MKLHDHSALIASLGVGAGHIPASQETIQADLDSSPHFVGGAPNAPDDGPDFIFHGARLLESVDQGFAASCEGESTASAICMALRIQGYNVARPSGKALWDFARLNDQPGKTLLEIGNVGTNGRSVFAGAQEFGLVAEDRYPTLPTQEQLDVWLAHLPPAERTLECWLVEAPPQDVFAHGVGAELKSFSQIEAGPGAACRIQHALNDGHVVQYFQWVDASYVDWKPEQGVWRDRVPGAAAGAHAQVYCGRIRGQALVDFLKQFGATPPPSGACLITKGSYANWRAWNGFWLIDVDYADKRPPTETGDYRVPLAGPRAIT